MFLKLLRVFPVMLILLVGAASQRTVYHSGLSSADLNNAGKEKKMGANYT
jgi:hypothetical protein